MLDVVAGPPHRILGKVRQLQEPVGVVVLGSQLCLVLLPQHPQVHPVRRERLETLRVEPGQVERLGGLPLLVEPGVHVADRSRQVVEQVQLQVRRQPSVGEVRRPDHRPTAEALDDERLAVQEPVGEPTDLDTATTDEVDEATGRVGRLTAEPQQVAVQRQTLVVAAEAFAEDLAGEPLWRHRKVQASDRWRFRLRFGTQQEADPRCLFQLVGHQHEPGRVEIRGGDRHRRRFLQLGTNRPQMGVERPGDLFVVSVRGDRRLRLGHRAQSSW